MIISQVVKNLKRLSLKKSVYLCNIKRINTVKKGKSKVFFSYEEVVIRCLLFPRPSLSI